jgi:hypothetical protein
MGGCHPRDNIAMSWFARQVGLSCNWFEHVMSAREQQAGWLADLLEEHDLPKAIEGLQSAEGDARFSAVAIGRGDPARRGERPA